MGGQTGPSTGELRRAAVIQTLRGMTWKFAVVVAALCAYWGLRAMESAKGNYDAERTRPVVIVNDEDARAGAAAGRADALRLSVTSVVNTIREADGPEPGGRGPGPREELAPYVHQLKYQNFRTPQDVVDRLNEQILAGAEVQKKVFLDSQENLSKERAQRLRELSLEAGEVRGRLRELYAPANAADGPAADEKIIDENINSAALHAASGEDLNLWRESMKAPRERPDKRRLFLSLKADQLLSWLKALVEQSNNESQARLVKDKIEAIDAHASKQLRVVYNDLRPELPRLIARTAGEQGQPSAVGPFNVRAVLDDKSGAHVIYQTLYLSCVVVLVFVVLFVILLLLRPLPFFSRGSETLMQQAGELFSRGGGGAAPQIMRSLAVTATALGVGAAVAVAGSGAISSKPQRPGGGGGGGEAEQAPAEQAGRSGRAGRDGRPGSTGGRGIDEHVVTLAQPIVVPSPVYIGGTSVTVLPDNRRLDAIDAHITALRAEDTIQTGTAGGLRKDLDQVGRTVKGIEERVGGVNVVELDALAKGFDTRVGAAERNLGDLMTWRMTFETNFANTLAAFQKDLAAANKSVQEMRENSLERRQNSGGRSLLTSATHALFKPNRYLVSNQSLTALSSLMCREPAPQGSGMECRAPGVNVILTVLRSKLHQPPMGDGALLKELRAEVKGGRLPKETLDAWKPMILKYTRVAY